MDPARYEYVTLPLLAANWLDATTLGALRSPSGLKYERNVDPRDMDMKVLHTNPKNATRPSRDRRMLAMTNLSSPTHKRFERPALAPAQSQLGYSNPRGCPGMFCAGGAANVLQSKASNRRCRRSKWSTPHTAHNGIRFGHQQRLRQSHRPADEAGDASH